MKSYAYILTLVIIMLLTIPGAVSAETIIIDPTPPIPEQVHYTTILNLSAFTNGYPISYENVKEYLHANSAGIHPKKFSVVTINYNQIYANNSTVTIDGNTYPIYLQYNENKSRWFSVETIYDIYMITDINQDPIFIGELTYIILNNYHPIIRSIQEPIIDIHASIHINNKEIAFESMKTKNYNDNMGILTEY